MKAFKLYTIFEYSDAFASHSIECGGVLTNTTGIITPQGFPGPIVPNTDCGWRIVVPEGYFVEISFLYHAFHALNQHQDYRDCINYLRIYDAPYPDKQFTRYT